MTASQDLRHAFVHTHTRTGELGKLGSATRHTLPPNSRGTRCGTPMFFPRGCPYGLA